jgi:hypothetical protein
MSECVLAASHYKQSCYFNPEYAGIPAAVKNRLKAAVICAAERARGIIAVYIKDGECAVSAEREENDLDFDETAARAAVDRLTDEQAENLRGIALWRALRGRG